MITPLLSYSAGSNCYIVEGSDKAVLVDAGINTKAVLPAIRGLPNTLHALINTHSHYDHIKGDSDVVSATGCDVWVHESDAEVMRSGRDTYLLGYLFQDPLGGVAVDRELRDGENIDLGGRTLKVVHTPGHTTGSICLLCPEENSLFTGDTVFADGVGRTDLPGGSLKELQSSIGMLADLVDEQDVKTIYPGHGPIGEAGDIRRNLNMVFI